MIYQDCLVFVEHLTISCRQMLKIAVGHFCFASHVFSWIIKSVFIIHVFLFLTFFTFFFNLFRCSFSFLFSLQSSFFFIRCHLISFSAISFNILDICYTEIRWKSEDNVKLVEDNVRNIYSPSAVTSCNPACYCRVFYDKSS